MEIIDQGARLTRIRVAVQIDSTEGQANQIAEFILVYENREGEILLPGSKGGEWRLSVWGF